MEGNNFNIEEPRQFLLQGTEKRNTFLIDFYLQRTIQRFKENYKMYTIKFIRLTYYIKRIIKYKDTK